MSRFRWAGLAALFALLVSLTPASSRAAGASATGKIAGFTIVDGWYYFWLENGTPLCASAGSNSRNIGVVTPDTVKDADARRWMLSLVISAVRDGRTVRVYATDNTAWGCRVTALGMD